MPTLARLSFFLPPAQLDDFAALYDRQLQPLLRPHGLDAGFSDDRPYVAGVFSRLFAVESPTALLGIQQVLRHDPAWKEALKTLGERLGVEVRYHLGIYSTPAGEGKVVEAGPGYRQGLWHTLGVADGLGSPLIGAMLGDREGRLWIATWDGLSCFDGAQFVNYTVADGLPGPKVRSLAQDPEGNLWVGTGGYIDRLGWGVCRFDGREWVSYTMADGLPGEWVSALAVDCQGKVWLATAYGVSCFDGQRFQTYTTKEGLVHDCIWSLLADRQGTIWAGSHQGVSRFDGTGFTSLGLPLGTLTCQVEKVEGLLLDQQGALWLTLSEGAARWDGQTFTRLGQEGEGKGLLEDRAGRVWWAAFTSGVRCWDQGQLHCFDTGQGLSNNLVVALAQDGAGQVWAGTQGGGLCRYEGDRFFTLTREEGLADNGMYTMLEDRQDRLWIGTFSGVNCWDGKEFTLLNIHTTGTDQWRNAAMVIHEDPLGQLWFVNFRGDVKCYDGQEVVTLHHSEGRHSYKHIGRSIVADLQGRLWFATGEPGVLCYDQGQWRLYTQADGLVEDDVRAIGLDRHGCLWFATACGGVSRWDGQGFVTVTRGEGLGHAPGQVIREDRQGYLWFATDGVGVSRWDGERFTRFTTREGLAYDRVFAILEDERGHLWFGTQGGGVSRYDGQVFQTLSAQDGLVNNAVQQIIRTRQGQLWITTAGGITRYQPSTQPPGVRLLQVIADRPYAAAGPLSVSHAQGLVRFEFQGRSFTSRLDRLVYRYRLQGHDAKWQTTGKNRAEYFCLPVGEYTFQVQAVDRDLNYSEPATVALEITPDPQAEALKEMVERTEMGGEFIGESAALRQVKTFVAQMGPTELTVLILGETGTGKGITARLLHELSPRRDGMMVHVNCAAIPKGLEESELFGHEKGAFTSADSRKIGKVERAAGGTLFLDEIGDLPLETQAKLLQLLGEGTFERVGGTQTLKSDARVIAATNRDLERMVREGTFRGDLYYRLQMAMVQLPPLRERREDILPLARHFIAQAAATLGKKPPGLTLELEALLLAYRWPGNVRQLKHLLDSAVVVCQEPYLWKQHLPINLETQPLGQEEWVSLDENERRYILQVLDQTQGIIKGPKGAAAILGKHEATLRNRMRKLGIARKAG